VSAECSEAERAVEGRNGDRVDRASVHRLRTTSLLIQRPAPLLEPFRRAAQHPGDVAGGGQHGAARPRHDGGVGEARGGAGDAERAHHAPLPVQHRRRGGGQFGIAFPHRRGEQGLPAVGADAVLVAGQDPAGGAAVDRQQGADRDVVAHVLAAVDAHQAEPPVALADIERDALAGRDGQRPQGRLDERFQVQRLLEEGAEAEQRRAQAPGAVGPAQHEALALQRGEQAHEGALVEAGAPRQFAQRQPAVALAEGHQDQQGAVDRRRRPVRLPAARSGRGRVVRLLDRIRHGRPHWR
jgi:hypothetical protein